jgi:hypothetical protein
MVVQRNKQQAQTDESETVPTINGQAVSEAESNDTQSEITLQPTQKPICSVHIDELEALLKQYLTESKAIQDSDLSEPLKSAVAEVAKLLGFTEYNKDKTETFYFAVNSDSSRIRTPSIRKYGDSIAINWGLKTIVIAGDTPIKSKDLMLSVEDWGCILFVDPRGYNFPLSMGLKAEFIGKDKFKTIKTDMNLALTAKDLSNFLQHGEPVVKWSDIADGTVVNVTEKEAVIDRNNAQEVKWYYGITEINELPSRIYLPGKSDNWHKATMPLQLRKVNDSAVTDGAGNTYELGGSFAKLSELNIGQLYAIVGVETSTGQYGEQYLLISSTGLKINANTAIARRLTGTNPPEISEKMPAKLIVDSIKELATGNKQAMARLTCWEDMNNPVIKKLMKENPDTNPTKNLEPNYDKIPF